MSSVRDRIRKGVCALLLTHSNDRLRYRGKILADNTTLHFSNLVLSEYNKIIAGRQSVNYTVYTGLCGPLKVERPCAIELCVVQGNDKITLNMRRAYVCAEPV